MFVVDSRTRSRRIHIVNCVARISGIVSDHHTADTNVERHQTDEQRNGLPWTRPVDSARMPRGRVVPSTLYRIE